MHEVWQPLNNSALEEFDDTCKPHKVFIIEQSVSFHWFYLLSCEAQHKDEVRITASILSLRQSTRWTSWACSSESWSSYSMQSLPHIWWAWKGSWGFSTENVCFKISVPWKQQIKHFTRVKHPTEIYNAGTGMIGATEKRNTESSTDIPLMILFSPLQLDDLVSKVWWKIGRSIFRFVIDMFWRLIPQPVISFNFHSSAILNLDRPRG